MRLDAENSIVVVVDIQQRLAPAIDGSARLIEHARLLVSTAILLNIPVMFTEHYPSGLGETVEILKDAAPDAIVFEKIHFDATRESVGLRQALAASQRQQVLILGCETHVCVMQTAFGIQDTGYAVALVNDASGSRRPDDKRIAIDRMNVGGIVSVSSEMVAFEWLARGDHPAFKQVLPAIKAL